MPSASRGRNGNVWTGLRLGAWVMTTIVVTLGVSSAGAADFRVSHSVKAREAKVTLLEGEVVNQTGHPVVDVWVTAEALSASGKVLATGIAFVSSMIPRDQKASFVAKVPVAEGVESFRVAVTSFRPGATVESP